MDILHVIPGWVQGKKACTCAYGCFHNLRRCLLGLCSERSSSAEVDSLHKWKAASVAQEVRLCTCRSLSLPDGTTETLHRACPFLGLQGFRCIQLMLQARGCLTGIEDNRLGTVMQASGNEYGLKSPLSGSGSTNPDRSNKMSRMRTLKSSQSIRR